MYTLNAFRIKSTSSTNLMGAFLAGHAISDAIVFLVTGIGCKAKVTNPLSEQDFKEDFTTRMGWAEFDEHDIISGNLQKIKRGILGQINRRETGCILVVISAIVKTVGLEIRPYLQELQKTINIPLLFINNSGTTSSLWEGYTEVMKAFAFYIDWQLPAKDAHTVNIWGYPFDRYEQDNIGNCTVLQELLAAIGLKLNCLYFSGSSTKDLLKAPRAAYNIILPHANKLGAALEEISGRPSIYTDLPLGFKGTAHWLQLIGNKTKRKTEIINSLCRKNEAMLTKNLTANKRKLKNKTCILILDLPFLAGITSLLKELGVKTKSIYIRDTFYGGTTMLQKTLKFYGIPPSDIYISEEIDYHKINLDLNTQRIDYIIAPATEQFMLHNNTAKRLTFGFPSYDQHFLDQAMPYLGFSGKKQFSALLCNAQKKTIFRHPCAELSR